MSITKSLLTLIYLQPLESLTCLAYKVSSDPLVPFSAQWSLGYYRLTATPTFATIAANAHLLTKHACGKESYTPVSTVDVSTNLAHVGSHVF